jgi:hypothetical protein
MVFSSFWAMMLRSRFSLVVVPKIPSEDPEGEVMGALAVVDNSIGVFLEVWYRLDKRSFQCLLNKVVFLD